MATSKKNFRLLQKIIGLHSLASESIICGCGNNQSSCWCEIANLSLPELFLFKNDLWLPRCLDWPRHFPSNRRLCMVYFLRTKRLNMYEKHESSIVLVKRIKFWKLFKDGKLKHINNNINILEKMQTERALQKWLEYYSKKKITWIS